MAPLPRNFPRHHFSCRVATYARRDTEPYLSVKHRRYPSREYVTQRRHCPAISKSRQSPVIRGSDHPGDSGTRPIAHNCNHQVATATPRDPSRSRSLGRSKWKRMRLRLRRCIAAHGRAPQQILGAWRQCPHFKRRSPSQIVRHASGLRTSPASWIIKQG